jgi:hypothetical protein
MVTFPSIKKCWDFYTVQGVCRARRPGKIKADDSLHSPRFCIENGMETWLRQPIVVWIQNSMYL